MNMKFVRTWAMLALTLVIGLSVTGGTIAWFTDSVSSTGNVIQSGTLKVALDYKDDNGQWADASTGAIFNYDKWEPGYTQVREVKLKNVGSLAFKYRLNLKPSVQPAAGETNLADVIDVYVGYDENQVPTTREMLASGTKVGTISDLMTRDVGMASSVMQAGSEGYMWIALHMQEEAGNEYQGLSVGEGFSLVLEAAQLAFEGDSFGSDYDEDATYSSDIWTGGTDDSWNTPEAENAGEYVITTAAQFADFRNKVNAGNNFAGKTIKLAANIDLNNARWTPIGSNSAKFNGTFDGQGHTISNLYVQGGTGVGLFGYVFNSAHIKNVVIDGAHVSGRDYVGAVLGTGYMTAAGVSNCTVKNAEIIAEPYQVSDGNYDGGAKAGVVVGYVSNGNITGNKAINSTVSAYRDLGGIAGMVSGENRAVTVSGNTVDHVTLSYLALEGAKYDGDKVNQNMGEVVGRCTNVSNASTLATDNTVTATERDTKIMWDDNGITYIKDADDPDNVILYLVTDSYTSDTVNVPKGVTTIGSYAFAYNNKIETIELPSTVTTLADRAFRDTSASTVKLNEGLTNISYQAFRNALNVTSVEIPSTVTTISKEAFQLSGIKTLTIPANVTTIEYGAMRDMKELETVTINGDSVHIPDYAFRACTKLKTIYLNVNSLTLGNNMIFTNEDNNNADPNNITIYVQNENVLNTLNSNPNVKCTITLNTTTGN